MGIRRSTQALFCTLLFTLGACGGDALGAGTSGAWGTALPTEPSLSGSTCQTLTKAATKYTGSTLIETAVNAIASNCPTEWCGGDSTAVSPTFVLNGNNTNNNDQITYRCRSNTTLQTGALKTSDSQEPCWNCVYGCATNCPAGYECYPIPGTNGVDCTPYKCDMSDGKNWQLVYTYYGQAPVCQVQDCPPPPLSITVDGPSSIRPGAECTWMATPSGGTGGPYTITWYVSSQVVGYGTYYTGSKPSGVSGSNYSLKAEVYDGSTATYTLFPVSESSSAPLCMS